MDDIQLISGKRGTFQEYIAEVRADARNAALEEAAKVCDHYSRYGIGHDQAGQAADAIRALKT